MATQYNLNLVAEYLTHEGVNMDVRVAQSFRVLLADKDASVSVTTERLRTLAVAVDLDPIVELLNEPAPTWG